MWRSDTAMCQPALHTRLEYTILGSFVIFKTAHDLIYVRTAMMLIIDNL